MSLEWKFHVIRHTSKSKSSSKRTDFLSSSYPQVLVLQSHLFLFPASILAETMPRPTLRLLLLPISYPLFVLLHLIFCVFSLLLRIYQALTTPLSSTIDIEHVPPPKHIGLVLVPTMRSAGSARGRANGMSGKERRKREREGLVESVRRVVEWAGERDVAEVSVWDGQGM